MRKFHDILYTVQVCIYLKTRGLLHSASNDTTLTIRNEEMFKSTSVLSENSLTVISGLIIFPNIIEGGLNKEGGLIESRAYPNIYTTSVLFIINKHIKF